MRKVSVIGSSGVKCGQLLEELLCGPFIVAFGLTRARVTDHPKTHPAENILELASPRGTASLLLLRLITVASGNIHDISQGCVISSSVLTTLSTASRSSSHHCIDLCTISMIPARPMSAMIQWCSISTRISSQCV